MSDQFMPLEEKPVEEIHVDPVYEEDFKQTVNKELEEQSRRFRENLAGQTDKWKEQQKQGEKQEQQNAEAQKEAKGQEVALPQLAHRLAEGQQQVRQWRASGLFPKGEG